MTEVEYILSRKEGPFVNVWVPILLLLILVEIWLFGIHCTTYLSDIRDSLNRTANQESAPAGNDD